VLAYSPLEQGLLTGKVGPERTFGAQDGRAKRPSFAPEQRARVNAALASAVEPVARRRGASVAQVVIAWTCAQPGISAALVGARDAEQVRENARAGELALEPGELASIGAAFEALQVEAAPARPRGGVLRSLVRRLRG
jgi:aryl-alcohol dehydrogenase-like predicted oxidoreductase